MNKLLKQGLLSLRKMTLLMESRFDKHFLAPDVPIPKTVSHQKWQKYLYEIGNKPGMKANNQDNSLTLASGGEDTTENAIVL